MTETETAPTETSNDELGQVLERGVRFAMLRLEGIPGNRKVPGTRVMLGEKELDKTEFSDPTRRLLPASWREKFSTVKNKAAAIVRKADPRQEGHDDGELASQDLDAFDIPGVSMLAASKFAGVEEDLTRLNKDEFEPLVAAFLLEYPELVAAVRKSLNDEAAWSVMQRRIPSATELKFRMRLRFIRVPITFLGEAGREIAERVAKRIVLGLTKGIEAEAAKIRMRAAERGTFKSSSFNGLREKFQLLKDFGFLASPETLAKLHEVEQTFETLGGQEGAHYVLNQDLKSSEQTVVADMGAALLSLTAEARKDAGGRFKRSIQI